MGQTITSVTDMVSYAGELRRAAQATQEPELAKKIQRSAAEIEQTAIQKVLPDTASHLGRLLDTFA